MSRYSLKTIKKLKQSLFLGEINCLMPSGTYPHGCGMGRTLDSYPHPWIPVLPTPGGTAYPCHVLILRTITCMDMVKWANFIYYSLAIHIILVSTQMGIIGHANIDRPHWPLVDTSSWRALMDMLVMSMKWVSLDVLCWTSLWCWAIPWQRSVTVGCW